MFLKTLSTLILELRQYKNGVASVKNMFVLKLPHLHGKGKRAATSRLACVSQKRIRSIVLALGQKQRALKVNKKCPVSERKCFLYLLTLHNSTQQGTKAVILH